MTCTCSFNHHLIEIFERSTPGQWATTTSLEKLLGIAVRRTRADNPILRDVFDAPFDGTDPARSRSLQVVHDREPQSGKWFLAAIWGRFVCSLQSRVRGSELTDGYTQGGSSEVGLHE